MLQPKGHKTIGDRGYTIADEILTALEDGWTIPEIEEKINLYLLALKTDLELEISLTLILGG